MMDAAASDAAAACRALIIVSAITDTERQLDSLCRDVGLVPEFVDVAGWQQASSAWRERTLRDAVCLDRVRSAPVSRALMSGCARAGARCINPLDTIERCTDRLALDMALVCGEVASPDSAVAMTPGGAAHAAQEVGFPLTIRVLTGGWTRWSVSVDDEQGLQAVLRIAANTDQRMLEHVYHLQAGQERSSQALVLTVIDGRAVQAEHVECPSGARRSPTTEPIDQALEDCASSVCRAIGAGAYRVAASRSREGTVQVTSVDRHVQFPQAGTPDSGSVQEHYTGFLARCLSGAEPH